MTRSPFVVAALLPVLLVTACGGGDESAATEPATTPPATTPATSAAPPPPSPSPSRALPAPGTAADGRDLDACRDGECDVVVKKGDVLRFNDKIDTAPLTVLSAGENLTVTSPSGTTSITGGGSIQMGSVHIEVGEWKGNRTAIRVSPRG